LPSCVGSPNFSEASWGTSLLNLDSSDSIFFPISAEIPNNPIVANNYKGIICFLN
jgi:hypothetical protein